MTQNNFQMTSSAVSDRGLSEKRPQNEDSYLEMPERGIFAVADGVGGAQAGDVASQMAIEILSEAFANLRDGGDVEELMEIAISRANESIFQMSHDLPQLSTMATTIVALHIADNIATIGHAGDSRLYRLDSRGQLFRETQDHSVVEEEVRAGRMTPQQAEYHPSKNVISRALGAERTIEVDMKTIMFDANTTFLLCSDGVTRHIPDVEIGHLLASPQSLPEICRQIKEVCYSRGAEDNLTAVLVRVTGDSVSSATDYEESTVATSRTSQINSAVFAQNESEEENEIPTRNLQMPDLGDNFQSQQNESIVPVSASFDNSSQSVAEAEPQSKPVQEIYYPATKDKDYAVEEKSDGNGFFGKLLTALLSLIIGAGIGAAAIYFWLQSQPKPEVPVISKVETPNIPFSAFENNRRNVDKNPAQYIIASGTTAEDAEDYYLLGRAYVLTGKYTEARDAFTKAKERLPMLTSDDKTMLANEIALGLASITDAASRKILEESKTSSVPAETNTNTNTTN
jgi:PPM family protein phosphatase